MRHAETTVTDWNQPQSQQEETTSINLLSEFDSENALIQLPRFANKRFRGSYFMQKKQLNDPSSVSQQPASAANSDDTSVVVGGTNEHAHPPQHADNNNNNKNNNTLKLTMSNIAKHNNKNNHDSPSLSSSPTITTQPLNNNNTNIHISTTTTKQKKKLQQQQQLASQLQQKLAQLQFQQQQQQQQQQLEAYDGIGRDEKDDIDDIEDDEENNDGLAAASRYSPSLPTSTSRIRLIPKAKTPIGVSSGVALDDDDDDDDDDDLQGNNVVIHQKEELHDDDDDDDDDEWLGDYDDETVGGDDVDDHSSVSSGTWKRQKQVAALKKYKRKLQLQQQKKLSRERTIQNLNEAADSQQQQEEANHHMSWFFSARETLLKGLRSLLGDYWKLLTNRKFFWLFLGNFISTFGNFFTNIAILTLVETYSSQRLSGIAISGVYMAFLIPPIVLMPITGVMIDLFDRRKIMIVADMIRFVLVLLFLPMTLIDPNRLLWMVYPILVLVSSVNSFFDPCHESMIPLVVEDKSLLVAANALDSLTWMSCMFLGSSLGGLVYATLGPTVNIVIDSVSFLFSAFCVLQMLLTPNFYGNEEAAIKSSDIDKDIKLGRVHKDYDIETNDDVDLMTATSTASHMSKTDTHTSDHVISLRRDDMPRRMAEPMTLDDVINPAMYKPPLPVRLKKAFFRHIKEFIIGLKFMKDNKYLLTLCLLKSTGMLMWGGVLELISLKFSNTFFRLGDDASAMLGIVKALVGVGSGLAPVVVERTITIIQTKRRLRRIERTGIEEEPDEIWDPNISRGVIIFSLLAILIGNLFVFVSPSIHATFFFVGLLVLGSGAGVLWAVSSSVIFYVCPKQMLGRAMSLDVGFFLCISQVVSVTGGGLLFDTLRMKNAQPLTLIYISAGMFFCLLWSAWWILYKNREHEPLSMPELAQQEQESAPSQFIAKVRAGTPMVT